MDDRRGLIVETDPRPILAAGADRSGESELGGGQKGLHRAAAAEDESRACGDHSGRLGRQMCCRLPRSDHIGQEALPLRGVFGQSVAGLVSVEPDRRPAHEDGGRPGDHPHRIGQRPGRADPRVEDLLPVARRPRKPTERRAGQVHDRVHALHHCEIDDARRGSPVDLIVLLRLASDEPHDRMPGVRELP